MQPAVLSEKERLFENAYGYFDAKSQEFVIQDVRTPRPWANVLSNDRYGLVLSQSGGGFSWADNCQLFRLTRWEQDLVSDAYGRYLYIQDRENRDQLWSTTFQPTRVEADFEEIRHGLGYSIFKRRVHEIETRHTFFIPEQDCLELWIVEIENLSNRPRQLRLGSYLEWHLGGIGDWHREFHRLFMESRQAGNTLVAWKHPGLVEHQRTKIEEPMRAFASWSGVEEVTWITDKQAWLGSEGTPAAPAAFSSSISPSATPRWDEPIAGGMASIVLAPGETRTLVISIGAAPTENEALTLAAKYEKGSATAALEATKKEWRKRCDMGIETGDSATDLMINAWLPYQSIAGRLWARCAYYQQGGAYGYRDQLQDSLMLLEHDPERTLLQLGRHAEAMYSDGGVRHWWHPGTEIYVDSHHSDTSLWLAYGTLAYLESTGNLGVLDKKFKFLSRDSDVPWVRKHRTESGALEPIAVTKGSLLEHCLRGIDRALSLLSPRGLPLIGAGDWNDGLSHAGIDGKGESVWLAMFLFDVLTRFQPFLDSNPLVQSRYREAASFLKGAVNEHAWDGEWYLGGTRDDANPFGSHLCSEGKIFLNPQTWAVISGIAPPDRAKRALESVREHLVKPYGALLLQPAYSQVDPYIGYITRYAPGLRENGGVYSHASTWAVWAFLEAGDRETAWAIFRGMLPPLRAEIDADLYAAEPYVMPGNVDGPDSPYAGRAGWTWYTGSAAWMVRIAKMLSSDQKRELQGD